MGERKNYGNDYQKFGGLNIGRDLRLWGFPQDIFDSLFCQATEEELRMQLGSWSAVGVGLRCRSFSSPRSRGGRCDWFRGSESEMQENDGGASR